eukprot:8614-Heterococcus_DN1.PRE.6
MVNKSCEAVYVKFHFNADQGILNLSADEVKAILKVTGNVTVNVTANVTVCTGRHYRGTQNASAGSLHRNQFLVQPHACAAELGGTDPDYATRDLYNAIASGDFPSWTAYIQVMDYEDAHTMRMNPFDVTKVWSHKEFPLIENLIVTEHSPTEQSARDSDNKHASDPTAAFDPSNFVPGIEPSPDKMLQGRLLSYIDTHSAVQLSMRARAAARIDAQGHNFHLSVNCEGRGCNILLHLTTFAEHCSRCACTLEKRELWLRALVLHCTNLSCICSPMKEAVICRVVTAVVAHCAAAGCIFVKAVPDVVLLDDMWVQRLWFDRRCRRYQRSCHGYSVLLVAAASGGGAYKQLYSKLRVQLLVHAVAYIRFCGSNPQCHRCSGSLTLS